MEKKDDLMPAHSGLPPHHHPIFAGNDFGRSLFMQSQLHKTGSSPTGWFGSLYTRMTLGAGYVKITTS